MSTQTYPSAVIIAIGTKRTERKLCLRDLSKMFRDRALRSKSYKRTSRWVESGASLIPWCVPTSDKVHKRWHRDH